MKSRLQFLLDNWYWKEVLLASLTLLVAVAAAYTFSFLIKKIRRRWVSRRVSTLKDHILEATRKSGSLLILLVGIYATFHRYKFRLLVFLDGLIFVIGVALVIGTLIQVAVALLRWYGEKIGREREGETLARELLPLADKVLRIVLLAIGLVVVLDHFRIDIKSILVTLGIGSLAIGLALQDTLANMFGGFTIMLDRPFRVGDRIQLASGETGDVQLIGIRSTSVLMLDGNMLIIPNAYLVKTMVINHSLPSERARIVVQVGVAYSDDTDQAKQLMLEAADQHPQIMQNPKPVAFFKSFGESSLNLELVCHTTSFHNVVDVTDTLNSAIHQKFKAAQIEIPFPIRTVHLKESGDSGPAAAASVEPDHGSQRRDI